MEKKDYFGKFIGPTFLVAVFIASFILVIKSMISNWSTIITWPNYAWNLATDYSPWVTFAVFVCFYTGIFIRTINEPLLSRERDWWYRIGRPISDIAYYFRLNKSKNKQKLEGLAKVGRSLIWIFGIWAILNIFPFANYSGILKTLSVVLGGIALASLEIFFLNKFKALLKLDNLLGFIAVILLLFFTYYLDFFIFGWNKPKISALVIILAVLFKIAMRLINAIKRVKNIAEIKRGLEKLAEEKRLEAEKAKAHFEELQQSGLYKLFVNYVKCKKEGNQEEVALIIKAYSDLKLEGNFSLDKQEKLSILRKIHAINFNVDKKLFALIAMEYDDDCETMLFTHTNEPLYRDGSFEALPILFKYSDKKKEIIFKFIEKGISKNTFFNMAKKELRFPEYIQTLNALIFAYKKEWNDWEMLLGLIAIIKELLDIGVKAVDKIWDKHMAIILYSFLELLEKKFQAEGIQVEFPKIPEISEDEDDESPVV